MKNKFYLLPCEKLPDFKSYFNMDISGDIALNHLLNKLKLKKYVNFNQTYDFIYKKFPILKKFGSEMRFSSTEFNEYIGYKFLPYKGKYNSLTLNIILNKLYYKPVLKKFIEEMEKAGEGVEP